MTQTPEGRHLFNTNICEATIVQSVPYLLHPANRNTGVCRGPRSGTRVVYVGRPRTSSWAFTFRASGTGLRCAAPWPLLRSSSEKATIGLTPSFEDASFLCVHPPDSGLWFRRRRRWSRGPRCRNALREWKTIADIRCR